MKITKQQQQKLVKFIKETPLENWAIVVPKNSGKISALLKYSDNLSLEYRLEKGWKICMLKIERDCGTDKYVYPLDGWHGRKVRRAINKVIGKRLMVEYIEQNIKSPELKRIDKYLGL